MRTKGGSCRVPRLWNCPGNRIRIWRARRRTRVPIEHVVVLTWSTAIGRMARSAAELSMQARPLRRISVSSSCPSRGC
jgi:hypothetical protein